MFTNHFPVPPNIKMAHRNAKNMLVHYTQKPHAPMFIPLVDDSDNDQPPNIKLAHRNAKKFTPLVNEALFQMIEHDNAPIPRLNNDKLRNLPYGVKNIHRQTLSPLIEDPNEEPEESFEEPEESFEEPEESFEYVEKVCMKQILAQALVGEAHAPNIKIAHDQAKKMLECVQVYFQEPPIEHMFKNIVINDHGPHRRAKKHIRVHRVVPFEHKPPNIKIAHRYAKKMFPYN